TCPTCNGRGQVSASQRRGYSQFITITTCPKCNGRGQWPERPCPRCSGEGRIAEQRTIAVEIPPGVPDGVQLRVPGRGLAGDAGAAPGDLYVAVHVRPDERFARDGDDVIYELPITFAQAALGAEVEVPTLDGTSRRPLPAGIQTGVPGDGGAAPGGLHAAPHVRPDERCARDGDDVIYELPITFAQAALGAEVEVPTLDGTSRLRIPAGIQSGLCHRGSGPRPPPPR